MVVQLFVEDNCSLHLFSLEPLFPHALIVSAILMPLPSTLSSFVCNFSLEFYHSLHPISFFQVNMQQDVSKVFVVLSGLVGLLHFIFFYFLVVGVHICPGFLKPRLSQLLLLRILILFILAQPQSLLSLVLLLNPFAFIHFLLPPHRLLLQLLPQ